MSLQSHLRDDPALRQLSQLVVITVLLFALIWISSLIYFAFWKEFPPDLYALFLDSFLSGDIEFLSPSLATLIGAAPVVLGGVCFSTDQNARRLNRFGQICALVSFFGIVLAIIALWLLQQIPEDNHLGGPNLIQNLKTTVSFGFNAYIYYIALLIGVPGTRT